MQLSAVLVDHAMSPSDMQRFNIASSRWVFLIGFYCTIVLASIRKLQPFLVVIVSRRIRARRTDVVPVLRSKWTGIRTILVIYILPVTENFPTHSARTPFKGFRVHLTWTYIMFPILVIFLLYFALLLFVWSHKPIFRTTMHLRLSSFLYNCNKI